MMKKQSDIGRRLQQVRYERDYTVEYVANQTGIPQQPMQQLKPWLNYRVNLFIDNSSLEDIQSFESYTTFSNGYTDTVKQMSIKKFSMNNTKISDNIEVE